MHIFLRNYFRLFVALWSAITDRHSLHLLAMTASLIAVSTVFYTLVEGWGALDAAYFSVVTMSTVGYGDLVPVTSAGKIFTMVFTFCGIGIFVVTITHIASCFVREFRVELD